MAELSRLWLIPTGCGSLHGGQVQSLAGDAFTTGLVLYDGHQALSFGTGLWAVPLAAL